MNKFNKKKFIARIVIVYLVSLMIKGFDYSFGQLLDITIRGQIFSLFFVLLWGSAWYLLEAFNKLIARLSSVSRVLINIVCALIFSLITNVGYKYGDIYFYDNFENWDGVQDYNPELVISLTLMYLLSYTFQLYHIATIKVKEEQLKSEKLEKESILAHYKLLKSQIEPHFLFNSLSVLSSIIHTDVTLASEYILKLSKTLRYFIEKNNNATISLSEEFELLNNYFFLLKIRYGEKLSLSINYNNVDCKDILVPPTTIQLLLENAVKHNKLSESSPLKVEIELTNNYLVIKNNLNKRNVSTESTGVGLKNINQRYKILVNREIFVKNDGHSFIVKLPVLNKHNYESINY